MLHRKDRTLGGVRCTKPLFYKNLRRSALSRRCRWFPIERLRWLASRGAQQSTHVMQRFLIDFTSRRIFFFFTCHCIDLVTCRNAQFLLHTCGCTRLWCCRHADSFSLSVGTRGYAARIPASWTPSFQPNTAARAARAPAQDRRDQWAAQQQLQQHQRA